MIKIRLKTLTFYLILLLLAASSAKLISLPSRVIELLLIIFIVIHLVEKHFRICLTKDTILIFELFCIPWLIVMAYSLIIQFSQSMSADYKQHTFVLCLEMLLYFLSFYIAYEKIGAKVVDYFLVFFVIAYIPKIIAHFIKFGFVKGITLLYSEEMLTTSALEINKLTYLFGFITIYYLFCYLCKVNEKRKSFWFFILGLVMTIFGIKRIALFAVLLSVALLFLLLKIRNRRIMNRIVLTICVAMCILAMVYVKMIYDGSYERLVSQYNINTMGRTEYWELLRSVYNFNLDFLGHGISFTHNVVHDPAYLISRFSNEYISALHNDVLAVYIGLGYLGSLLYWFWFFFIKSKVLGKRIYAVGAFSLAISIQFFTDFSVSNVGLSVDPFALYSLLIVIAYFEYKKNYGTDRLEKA